jgi:hypothetical protein
MLLAGVALSPFLALFPRWLTATCITLLSLIAIVVPLYALFQILPAIRTLYNQPVVAAWGVWLMVAGLLATTISYWLPVKQAKV